MKRHIWQPIAFFIVGICFYVYYGVTWNAWIENLPLIIIYGFLMGALSWALWKKQQLKERRERSFRAHNN